MYTGKILKKKILVKIESGLERVWFREIESGLERVWLRGVLLYCKTVPQNVNKFMFFVFMLCLCY